MKSGKSVMLIPWLEVLLHHTALFNLAYIPHLVSVVHAALDHLKAASREEAVGTQSQPWLSMVGS
jgi:hypothetical protein